MAKDKGGHGSEKRGASDEAVAATLAGGHPKSAPVPVNGGATGRFDVQSYNPKTGPTAAQMTANGQTMANEHLAAMGRLKTTFKTGDNRFGSYGDNVRAAHDRHAASYSKLTGKPKPNIYD